MTKCRKMPASSPDLQKAAPSKGSVSAGYSALCRIVMAASHPGDRAQSLALTPLCVPGVTCHPGEPVSLGNPGWVGTIPFGRLAPPPSPCPSNLMGLCVSDDLMPEEFVFQQSKPLLERTRLNTLGFAAHTVCL